MHERIILVCHSYSYGRRKRDRCLLCCLVLVLPGAELVEGDVRGFLLPDVLRDRGLVHADGRDIVALCPELPVPEPVLEVRMPCRT
jgi:hypothetical protein